MAAGGAAICAALCFALCLTLRPDICAGAVRRALSLCAGTLVPAIFPFLAVNALICGAGGAELAARAAARPFRAFFGVNEALCAPFCLGLMSGFPSGGAAAVSVFESGLCTKEEAERALAFCSNTGPAFAVGGMGAMLGSARDGVLIYAVQIICALACAWVIPRGKPSPFGAAKKPAARTGSLVCEAVTGSVTPMLNICAFVVIFAPLCALARELLQCAGAGALWTGAALSVLEVTNAAAFVTAVLPRRAALALCSLALCWSGLCVHAQTMSAAARAGLSIKYCIAGKAFMGALGFVLTWLAAGIM